MKRRILKVCLLALLALTVAIGALADQVISTTLVMRVSHVTKSAVVNAGEDLSMEISIDGVAPASYRWYLNDQPIEGADQKVYTLVNAQVDDAGTYRMDAFDADGKLVVSMDISVRVIDPNVPKSGDGSLPMAPVIAVMGAAALVLIVMLRREAAE